MFEDIPWSTPEVFGLTLARATEIGLPVVNVPSWYDVDDAQSLALLETEFAGEPLPFAPDIKGAEASATRRFLEQRNTPLRAGASW